MKQVQPGRVRSTDCPIAFLFFICLIEPDAAIWAGMKQVQLDWVGSTEGPTTFPFLCFFGLNPAQPSRLG
jgi:hypothetical protein